MVDEVQIAYTLHGMHGSERGMTPMTPNPTHGGAFLWSRTSTPATELDESAGTSGIGYDISLL